VIDIHHALQRGDRDALFVLEAPAGAQHVSRKIRQVLGEGVLGLLGERDAIDEKENAGDGIRFEQAFDQGRGGPRLAGAGRHFNEHLAPTAIDFPAERFDARGLVIALDDVLVDGNRKWITPDMPGCGPSFQVTLQKERLDGAGERFALPFPEADFFAVGEEDIGHFELRGVGLACTSASAGLIAALLASITARARP